MTDTDMELLNSLRRLRELPGKGVHLWHGWVGYELRVGYLGGAEVGACVAEGNEVGYVPLRRIFNTQTPGPGRRLV